MTNLSEQRQQFCCCSTAVCFPEQQDVGCQRKGRGVCACDSDHWPTGLLRAVTQEHILGRHTPPHKLCNIFFIHAPMQPVCHLCSLNCDGRNEGQRFHSLLLSLSNTHTQRQVQAPSPTQTLWLLSVPGQSRSGQGKQPSKYSPYMCPCVVIKRFTPPQTAEVREMIHPTALWLEKKRDRQEKNDNWSVFLRPVVV